MRKKWIIKEADSKIIDDLSNGLGMSKIIAQVLANRGIKTQAEARVFLRSGLQDLRDPFQLKDMQKAVDRIKKAISNKEKIFISSDYDVDGITSCAVLEQELKRLGADVIHYIPHRVKEGYGLSPQAVKLASSKGVKLLFTLDCGINNHKQIKNLGEKGIDTIIVDHHEPDGERLPEAFAIINPKRSDCPFGFSQLAAVGLVYKLVCALEASNQERYLDLVSLGTVADVMPLIDDNRIIVKRGLESINDSSNIGVQALIEASGLKGKEINPGRISFALAPRINASGRVDSAELALDLFLCDAAKIAQQMASDLNSHNRSRQKIQDAVFNEALEMVNRMHFGENHVIVLAKDDWHIGVLGIVASKIAEKFFRPTIIISFENGLGKGSGRSIQGFHLFDTLSGCKKHLKYFGGHAYAVGLSIEKENLKDFIRDLNEAARERITSGELQPTLNIDAQLPLFLLEHDLIEEIKALEPFGSGNAKPVFCSHNLKVKSAVRILGRDTIKFWVTDGERTYEAIGFGFRDMAQSLKPSQGIDLAYSLTLDTWNDVNSLLLEIKDLKLVG
ncbi:single-stranded-DNA-specific exonuclease RecJ [Thermoproteota archaeon]